MADKKIILNLDDNKDLTEVIGELLKRYSKEKGLNWEILNFTSPRKALEKVLKLPTLDLGIVNYTMPEFDGFEVTKILKKHFANCRIILQGACSAEEAPAAGADLYIRTPFDPDELGQTVAKLLGE